MDGVVEAGVEDGGGVAGVLGGTEDGDGVGGLGVVLAGDGVDLVVDPAEPDYGGEQEEAEQTAQEAGAAQPSGSRLGGSRLAGPGTAAVSTGVRSPLDLSSRTVTS